MELLFPRAKKDVWERRSVVRVMAVGDRSRRPGCVYEIQNGRWGTGLTEEH